MRNPSPAVPSSLSLRPSSSAAWVRSGAARVGRFPVIVTSKFAEASNDSYCDRGNAKMSAVTVLSPNWRLSDTES